MAPSASLPDVAHIEPDDLLKPAENHGRFTWTGMKADISKSHTDLPIIACSFASGLCDSSAFNAYGTFVSMQTGEASFLSKLWHVARILSSPQRLL